MDRWRAEHALAREIRSRPFHRRKRPVWISWRMDETYIKIKGQWYYLIII